MLCGGHFDNRRCKHSIGVWKSKCRRIIAGRQIDSHTRFAPFFNIELGQTFSDSSRTDTHNAVFGQYGIRTAAINSD